ncbi:MAG: glutaminase A [Actinomycetota bacterium]
MEAELIALHRELHGDRSGSLATYIPPLAKADPEWFAIAATTVDGHRYEVGDAGQRFTIQSVSKPFVFGLALDDMGADGVMERVGVEPTGDAFNSITVDETSGRPYNPMVNAGAIVTASLLRGADVEERERRMLDGLSRYAGRTVEVDEAVFESESRTGDRNRAIAYLMRSFGMLREDVDRALEAYFRQCSVLVDARDLALMGATLANQGVNPLTGERALASEHVARVLSVMGTCGMYDYAGEWLYRIGLPAKSGVSGGVVAVLPSVMAIASFSPRLDARGNSVRGIRACERLAYRFRLHVFDAPSAPSVVRRVFDGSQVRSKQQRCLEHIDALRAAGRNLVVIELQGPLHFGSAEVLTRIVARDAGDATHLVLDLNRVTSIEDGALPMIDALVQSAARRSTQVVGVGLFAEVLEADGGTRFASLDAALEWCEDEILGRLGFREAAATSELSEQELLRGLSPEAAEAVSAAGRREWYPAGAVVFTEGDAADAIYFVIAGRVSVGLHVDGRSQRLTTIGPGSCFGEMAIFDDGERSATVAVEEDAVCHVLPRDALARLENGVPGLVATLHRNLATMLARRLRDANEEIRALWA